MTTVEADNERDVSSGYEAHTINQAVVDVQQLDPGLTRNAARVFREVVLPTMDAQFWDKVSPEPNTGRWLWSGAINNHGYGLLRVGARVQYAHRVSYAMNRGRVPVGNVIDHKCRNRWCVNPQHLDLVSDYENIRRRPVNHSRFGDPAALVAKLRRLLKCEDAEFGRQAKELLRVK